jgi:pyridoxal 5'-phosphate synthase pdxS subunit
MLEIVAYNKRIFMDVTKNTKKLKQDFAKMFKGGVIMDVVNPEQARVAENAGAVAVMALERVPSDIRRDGGVARMSDPQMIKEILNAVSIPVMAKVRIGHFVEAQILESIGVDYIDESEVLTPADEAYHVNKHDFDVPFVCGATNLGEALRRVYEGAAMIRTKGEAGTGNVVEAVRHWRSISDEIEALAGMKGKALTAKAREYRVPIGLVERVKNDGRLPVVTFVAGGIATPADAAMMMQMGAEGVFVGSGIFKSENPELMAKAVVEATLNYDDPAKIAAACEGLGKAMKSSEIKDLEVRLAERGW